MKRHLTVLVASLALLLGAGVGTAYAGGPGLGVPADQTQTIDQSQTATNSIDQSATAQSAAGNVSPNVAIANNGPGDHASHAASGAGTGHGGGRGHGGGADPSQSIDQSQAASNSIDQTAKATSVAVNVSPNVAIANSGPVKQDSNASSEAVAVNKNDSQQSNTLRNEADQSQTGENHACGRGCKHESAPQSQDARQSQNASNSISQNAESKSFALNASPNAALLNGGPAKSGGCADGAVPPPRESASGAFAGNWNSSEQSNDLGQEARQSPKGGS